jgi:hypothetical protein
MLPTNERTRYLPGMKLAQSTLGPLVQSFAGVLVVSLLVPTMTGCSATSDVVHLERDGSHALFDGDTLNGWSSMMGGTLDAWGVQDGEIRVVNAGQGGWLRTDKMYRDFELTFEFIIPEGGNSGVGLRCTSVGDPAFTGFEVQILDSYGQEPAMYHAGAVYNAIPPAVQAINPAGRVEPVPHQAGRRHAQCLAQRRARPAGPEARRPRHLPQRRSAAAAERTRSPPGTSRSRTTARAGCGSANIRITDLSPDPDPGDFRPRSTGATPPGGPTAAAARSRSRTARSSPPTGRGICSATRRTPTSSCARSCASPSPKRPARRGRATAGSTSGPSRARRTPTPGPSGTRPRSTTTTGVRPTTPGASTTPRRRATGEPITRDGAWFDYRILAVGDRVRTWINGIPMVDAELTEFDEGTSRSRPTTRATGSSSATCAGACRGG